MSWFGSHLMKGYHLAAMLKFLNFYCQNIITGFEYYIYIAIFKVLLQAISQYKHICIFKRCFHGNGTSVELHIPSNIDLQHLSFPMIYNLCECKLGMRFQNFPPFLLYYKAGLKIVPLPFPKIS